MQVELFDYFWLDLKSWEVGNNIYQHWLTKSQLNNTSAQSNNRRTCRPTYNYNLQCSRVKYQVCAEMFVDTFGVLSRTVTGFLPLLVITHLLQLLLQKQFLLKPNLLKYLTIKCHENVKNSQRDSLNHLQQLNLIIVVQNIEIESLWNLEQLC